MLGGFNELMGMKSSRTMTGTEKVPLFFFPFSPGYTNNWTFRSIKVERGRAL